MLRSPQGKGTVGHPWDTSGIWPGPGCVLSVGIAHLVHLLSTFPAARKSYSWHMPHPSWALGSKSSSGEGLASSCGSGEPRGQKGGPRVRDRRLTTSDGSPWALASHLWCDLIQEKRGGESTALTEHHLFYVSFSFTSYVESVCCPTLLSRLSLGRLRLLTVFIFSVSPRASLYALRAFSVFIIYGALSLPFSFSHPPHTNPVKKLVTSGFLYAAGTKLRSGKLKSGATRQCSAACRDVWKVGFWNTLQSLLWDISSQCDTTGFDDDKHPVLTDCPW